jgi:RimJ/RimL family protein N-acetyltransferase
MIDTDRLILRPHGRDDYDSLLALWRNPDVFRYVGGKPATAEEAWSRLLRYAGHWALNGHGFWAVIDRADGRHVGDVGLFEGRRGLIASFGDAPEAGWAFDPSVHGRGYAVEAITAAFAWGKAERGFGRVVCMIDAANQPSIRLAAKLGFVHYADADYAGSRSLLFERPQINERDAAIVGNG